MLYIQRVKENLQCLAAVSLCLANLNADFVSVTVIPLCIAFNFHQYIAVVPCWNAITALSPRVWLSFFSRCRRLYQAMSFISLWLLFLLHWKFNQVFFRFIWVIESGSVTKNHFSEGFALNSLVQHSLHGIVKSLLNYLEKQVQQDLCN